MNNIENELQTFASQSASLVSQAKQLALALAPNTAQVWPGGAVFNSIQAAIDSISAANAQEQYQVGAPVPLTKMW